MLVGRRAVSFAFHTQVGAGSGVAFECTLADAAANASADSYTACSSPATYGNLTDGRYTFRVRAVNEQFADARTFIRVRALLRTRMSYGGTCRECGGAGCVLVHFR